MIFVLPQSAGNSFQCTFQGSLGRYGCFCGLQARPIFYPSVFSDSSELPFTSRKLSERDPRIMNTQALLLLLVLEAVYDTHPDMGSHRHPSARATKQGTTGKERFKSESSQEYQRYDSGKFFKDKAQSQQQSSRSKYQETPGSQRSEYQKAPHVSRPNMTKVKEAFDGLGLQGSNLNTITESQVSKAYKKKARIYHPDKVTNEKANESEEIFKKLVAYRDRLFDFINFRNNRTR